MDVEGGGGKQSKKKGKHYRYCRIKSMTITSIGYAVGCEVPHLMKPVCFLRNGKVVLVIEQGKEATIKREFHIETRFVLFDRETGVLEDLLPIDPDNCKYRPWHIAYTVSLVSTNLKR